MSGKKKIIHVLSSLPSPIVHRYDNPEDYIKNHGNAGYTKIDKKPYWVGYFCGDFHHKQAFETIKRTDEYDIECWRPYGSVIDKDYSGDCSGVKHRVFPSRFINIKRTGYWHWSKPMLEALRKEITSGEKVLINFHDGHTNFVSWMLLHLKPKNVPVVVYHRGHWFPVFDYQYRRKSPFFLLDQRRHEKSFNYISHYFSCSTYEVGYIKYKLKFENVSFLMDGIDFNHFVPGNKTIARKKLDLPLDKKIIIFVGRFDYTNGIDMLSRVYKRIKGKRDDVALLLVGGYKFNDCYEIANDAGAILVERVHESKLTDYYHASDFYTMPINNHLIQKFSGIGTASLQALACGLPMLSYNIIHLPGTDEEIKGIGRKFKTEDELYKNAMYMLDNPGAFKNCREIARKYFDEEISMKILMDKYDELFKMYYENGL